MELPSKFQIGDEVAYDTELIKGTGIIEQVRFTKSKIYYYILDKNGEFKDNMPSEYVSKINKLLNN